MKRKIIILLVVLLILLVCYNMFNDREVKTKVKLIDITEYNKGSIRQSTGDAQFIILYDDKSDNIEIVNIDIVSKRKLDFTGNIKCWIREGGYVEVVINGDLYEGKSNVEKQSTEEAAFFNFISENEQARSQQHIYYHGNIYGE